MWSRTLLTVLFVFHVEEVGPLSNTAPFLCRYDDPRTACSLSNFPFRTHTAVMWYREQCLVVPFYPGPSQSRDPRGRPERGDRGARYHHPFCDRVFCVFLSLCRRTGAASHAALLRSFFFFMEAKERGERESACSLFSAHFFCVCVSGFERAARVFSGCSTAPFLFATYVYARSGMRYVARGESSFSFSVGSFPPISIVLARCVIFDSFLCCCLQPCAGRQLAERCADCRHQTMQMCYLLHLSRRSHTRVYIFRYNIAVIFFVQLASRFLDRSL